jgi:hypothetical protein
MCIVWLFLSEKFSGNHEGQKKYVIEMAQKSQEGVTLIIQKISVSIPIIVIHQYFWALEGVGAFLSGLNGGTVPMSF